MKKILLALISATAALGLGGCASDGEDAPHVQSTTTTTEETRVRPAAGSVTETQTTRTY